MITIIEFKTAIEAAMFENNICTTERTAWDIWKLANNNTNRVLRVLAMSDEKEDESFYKYLKGLGAFKEVEFE